MVTAGVFGVRFDSVLALEARSEQQVCQMRLKVFLMFRMVMSSDGWKHWSIQEWTAGPIRDEPHSTYLRRFQLLVGAVSSMIPETRFEKDVHGNVKLRIISREDVEWHLGHMVMEASTPEEVSMAIRVAKQVETYRSLLLDMMAEIEHGMSICFLDRDARSRVRAVLEKMDQMEPGAEEFYRQQNCRTTAAPETMRETVDPNFDPFA